MFIHAPWTGRRIAIGAVAGLSLAATLGLAADQASANYTARVTGGTLQLSGDEASDTLALQQTPTTLVADVGADGTADFTFDRSTFSAVAVSAGAGDDEVRVANAADPLPLTIDGGSGNDTLLGANGNDTLIGGTGNDVVDGNIGADTARLGSGADHFQWDPGDGSDTVEGEGGSDVLDFNGSAASEDIDVSANGPRVRLFRNVGAITMDFDGIEGLNLRALAGSDNVAVNDLAGTDLDVADVDLNAVGGGGDAAADTVTATGTDGDDSVQVGSEDGKLAISGVGAKVRVTGAEPTVDNVTVATLDGSDTIASGVDFTVPGTIDVDGGAGSDTATYTGSAATDAIGIARDGFGAAAFTAGGGAMSLRAVESLDVQGLNGDDTITGQNGIGALTQLTLDGGSGDDTLRGGDGADTLLGGAGNDLVDGNIGADTARLGSGADHFQWDPGDGSDSVEGESGSDVLDFNGSAANEDIDVSANGSRVRLFRNVASITMDFDGIEALNVRTLAGSDNVTVGDLSGTALKTNDIDLSAIGGGPDGAPDTVVVNGSDRRDRVNVTRSGSQVVATGLAAQTRIVGSEPTLDTLQINTLGGDDDVTIAPDVSDLITPIANLGDGE